MKNGFFRAITISLATVLTFATTFGAASAGSSESLARPESKQFWMKLAAKNKFERSQIANTGVTIESVQDDFVIAYGRDEQIQFFKNSGQLLVSFELSQATMDFPSVDSNFHNYTEVVSEMRALATNNPDIAALEEIGKSLEGRPVYNLRISTDLNNSQNKPSAVFMGTHHAREHVSTEVPLMLAQYLIKEFKNGTPRIKTLLEGREIHIIPLVNPDGSEYDVFDGRYHSWRKNRSHNSGGTFGVDLNRNYGYGWGGGGASANPDDDTFRGPSAFSEPETQNIKRFIENHKNINMLLTFHTFSELILYPWGGKFDAISDERDLHVFETMAKTMAKWNNYKPEQSSDLYIASGDTTDWAYGEHKIFAFTFELDPKSMWEGGFYPGQAKIPVIFNKNLEACLYMIELSDNPYRTLAPQMDYGLNTDFFR